MHASKPSGFLVFALGAFLSSSLATLTTGADTPTVPLADSAPKTAPTPPTPPAEAPLKSVPQIAKETRPSLVKVTQEGREGAYGIGSGFVLSADGLIATNRHVIGEARRLSVETSDGKKHEVTEVVANDSHLDLAILRVRTQNLRPLELGDSSATRQGDPIVAMGNPEGLSFSVVEGVISEPNRDIEGNAMIQVAVPIERGNSGGPLLDRQGRVLGILTLKSARTENLGFAMPINALKGLLAHPNPIPMERWLTIGVLNPRFWKTLMGAQWTQRAGLINVTQPGSGFGGRSLCLWHESLPSEPFEATVTVRLDDESGAAGLAFCADGAERHYGFYPTGGKLRLTRFDGADVFRWRILAEVQSDAYREGDWNQLRIRVEGDRILGLVNEKVAVDLRDDGLRGGQAGLCKFRQTSASFKNFRVGATVAEPPLNPDTERLVTDAVTSLRSGKSTRQDTLNALLQDARPNQKALGARQKALEAESALLKDLSKELHQRAVQQALVAELAKPETDSSLLRCALLLSHHDNPDLDVESYERSFAHMAEELRDQPELSQGTSQAVERISRYLFEENGFHGSRNDYHHRSNSYLNEVLDDREGLPISLSVVFIELARLLRVQDVVGIPLPSRFMVGYRPAPDQPITLLDVYDGGKKLTLDEGIALVSENGFLSEQDTEPASHRKIILRMIRNLMAPLREERSASRQTLAYLDLLIALDPNAPREYVNRAMLREALGDKLGARRDVLWVLEHSPDFLPEEQRFKLERWLERLAP